MSIVVAAKTELMKSFIHFVFIAFGLCVAQSCQKHKKLEGLYKVQYIGTLTSDNENLVNMFHQRNINILKSSKHYIYCGFENFDHNDHVFSKNGNKISGYVPAYSFASPVASTVAGPYFLEGTWSIVDGKYHISGSYHGVFEKQTYNTDTTYTIFSETGSFTIIPN
jgi:hypothetical protein